MMTEQSFAVISTSGSQFKVKDGTVISVDRLKNDIGDRIIFDKILFYFKNGLQTESAPIICGEILSHYRDKKVRIIKFRRRKHSLKRQGFRADMSKVRIYFQI